jgi:ABC-2 type transport system permease protein
LRVVSRVRELWGYREVLWNLVRKELKVKYTASVLGTVWSLLNPLVFLAVFTFVVKMLGNDIPDFGVLLLSGLLGWNLFSVSLTAGAQSVIANANLVKKVAFPREILPLSAVGVALVDFVLQSAVLFVFLIVSGYGFHLDTLGLYPLAFACLLVFTTAVSLWVSALNVRYRDIQHLLGLGLLVWFWLTPIVYPGYQVQQKLSDVHVAGINLWYVYLLNPMASIVFGFQRALYGVVQPNPAADPILPVVSVGWLVAALSITLVVSIVLLYLMWRTFFALSGDFAEEL